MKKTNFKEIKKDLGTRPSYKNLLLPWNRPELEGWTIVGMNHYFVSGVKHLYCAMMNEAGGAIKAEGIDEIAVFDKLVEEASNYV